jgi:hypothetical protein
VRGFHEGLAAVQIGNLWGYIDTQGSLVIDAQFKYAFDFEDGIALVASDLLIYSDDVEMSLNSRTPGKWGFIRKDGTYLIQPDYEYAESFSESRAVVGFHARYYNPGNDDMFPDYTYDYNFIDLKGNLLFSENKKNITLWSYHDGMAFFQIHPSDDLHLYGFFNDKGEVAVEPVFRDVKSFSEGLAAVQTQDKNPRWGYIDKSGAWKIEPVYLRAYDFSDGYALVSEKEKGDGNRDFLYFINSQGKTGLNPDYIRAFGFSEGITCVSDNTGYSIINTSGENLKTFPDGIYAAGGFSDGMAPINNYNPDINNGMGAGGFITREGKVIMPEEVIESFHYSNPPPYFSEGLAPVLFKTKP